MNSGFQGERKFYRKWMCERIEAGIVGNKPTPSAVPYLEIAVPYLEIAGVIHFIPVHSFCGTYA
jgi:hypothetical protein